MREPGNALWFLRRNVQAVSIWALAALSIALFMALLTVGRYWVFSDPFPPGLDGAQWLSYGRAFAGGTGRSAESTYAPLVPILAHPLGLALGPVLGVRVLGTVVLILLAAAVWMAGIHSLGVVWGSLTAALVLPCTALAEPFYYGGYPQQASLAFGVFGLVMLLIASRSAGADARSKALAFASIAFLLASASHLLFGPLLLGSACLFSVAVSLERPDRRRYLLRAAACLAPAIAASALIARAFLDLGYRAPLAVSQRTLVEAWVYATRESPGLWAVMAIAGLAAALAAVVSNISRIHSHAPPHRIPEAVTLGIAVAAPGGLLMLATGQPRLAPPVLLGGAVLFAYACRQLSRTWVRLASVVLTGWCVLVFWLAGATSGFAREFAGYYQVFDASLIAATRCIPTASSGSIAVAADRRGWPIGWWVEALQERPVFTGSNPQWLAFPEEQSRASSTAALFASTDAHALRSRAATMGVEYLVMRKWDWIGWERWTDDAAFAPAIIYDDTETIVLALIPVSP